MVSLKEGHDGCGEDSGRHSESPDLRLGVCGTLGRGETLHVANNDATTRTSGDHSNFYEYTHRLADKKGAGVSTR
jgi:hypothetical protein